MQGCTGDSRDSERTVIIENLQVDAMLLGSNFQDGTRHMEHQRLTRVYNLQDGLQF